MEFRFVITPLFKTPVIRVTNNLVPQGFTGDRRSVLDAIAKISEIINVLGEASARAQGLSKPVTTAQKLRNSDHIVYLLAEDTGKNGCVTGLLKVGVKNLYVFDESGETKATPAQCVLDFYIHESRQRAGLGKGMFDLMLEREAVDPNKLAIDRPSDKLIAFLRKHYGLASDPEAKITASPNTALFGASVKVNSADDLKKRVKHQSAPSLPFVQTAPMGRFGAKKPTCSMAEIIHSTPTSITNEPHSTEIVEKNEEWNDEQSAQPSIDGDENDGTVSEDKAASVNIDYSKSVEDIMADIESVSLSTGNNESNGAPESNGTPKSQVTFIEPSSIEATRRSYTKPLAHNKQHTGMKNISFNVGAAVMPSNKMEFDQESPESFGVVKINRPVGKLASQLDNTDAMSTISPVNSEGLTEQGYFDLKFYHNKLW